MSMKHRLNVKNICLFASCGKNLSLFFIRKLSTLYRQNVRPYLFDMCSNEEKKNAQKVWFVFIVLAILESISIESLLYSSEKNVDINKCLSEPRSSKYYL